MRALVVCCQPRQGSFKDAVREVVLSKLRAVDAGVRLRVRHAEGVSA